MKKEFILKNIAVLLCYNLLCFSAVDDGFSREDNFEAVKIPLPAEVLNKSSEIKSAVKAKNGLIGGMHVKASRLGVVLDTSASMRPYLDALRQEITSTFNDSVEVDVNGCRLKELPSSRQLGLITQERSQLASQINTVIHKEWQKAVNAVIKTAHQAKALKSSIEKQIFAERMKPLIINTGLSKREIAAEPITAAEKKKLLKKANDLWKKKLPAEFAGIGRKDPLSTTLSEVEKKELLAVVTASALKTLKKENLKEEKVQRYTLTAMARVVQLYQVDALYWFSDLKDLQTPEALEYLRKLILDHKVRLYVKSMSEKPSPSLMRIITDSGGQFRYGGKAAVNKLQ